MSKSAVMSFTTACSTSSTPVWDCLLSWFLFPSPIWLSQWSTLMLGFQCFTLARGPCTCTQQSNKDHTLGCGAHTQFCFPGFVHHSVVIYTCFVAMYWRRHICLWANDPKWQCWGSAHVGWYWDWSEVWYLSTKPSKTTCSEDFWRGISGSA